MRLFANFMMLQVFKLFALWPGRGVRAPLRRMSMWFTLADEYQKKKFQLVCFAAATAMWDEDAGDNYQALGWQY